MSRPLNVADREAVIAFEMAHLGMGETPPGSNCSIPGGWYGINCCSGCAWCAMTQSWSFYQTLGFSPFPASSAKGFAACVAGAQWFRRQGKWAPGSATPKRGWLIFFIWTPGDIEHHVGLVLGARGPRDVDTIEGNTSDKVMLHRRRGSTIAGYGIIDYAQAPPSPHPAPIPAPALHFTRTLRLTAMRGHLSLAEGAIIRRLQELLTWQAAVHHAPDQDPHGVDGDPGPATVRAWEDFKRGVNAALAYRHAAPFFGAIDDSLGPKGLGLLAWWASR